MSTEITVQELKNKIGEEINVGEWLEITQDRINLFAECTGDHQWIHVDLDKASEGPFGKPIAHGYLTLSLLPFLQSGTSQFSIKGPKWGSITG